MGLLDKAKALKIEKQELKVQTAEKIVEQPKSVYAAGKVIETDFDVLYKLILNKERVKLSEVTKLFKIKKDKAEQWAQILDERGLVKIHYPAMGEPEIRKIINNEKAK